METTFTAETAAKIKTEIQRVIVGQDYVIDHMLNAMLSGGHVLLEGVPGTAKTLMVKSLAMAVSAEFKRIQFTPDLMPSDVVGTNIYDSKTSTFVLKQGPIFTNMALIDEVNRAPAKTQAALLEVMEERQVTIDGVRYVLSEPFMVFATQNPIEYEGTYALPEAQLDRFMFKILVDYPTDEDENRILKNYHGGFDAHHLDAIQKVVKPHDIEKCRQEIAKINIEEGVINYMSQIVRKTRDFSSIMVGGSPRASIALLLAAKTRAAMHGLNYVTPDDVKFVAPPILRHRIILQPEAELEGTRADEVIAELLSSVNVPR